MTTFEQSESEALIRLLIAAEYQDGLLSSAEDTYLAARLPDLPWSLITPRELFVKSAFAQVREAISSPAGRARFLREQCAHFSTPESRRQALETLETMIRVDGIGEGEEAFLEEIQKLLTQGAP